MSWSFDREAYDRRMEWYVSARFGLFLHWGLYAIPARGEWVRSVERIPNEQYNPLMAEFDPKACDMREWMAAAKAAGMKYAVLTAKHHDGFCLFDSAYTGFKSTNSPAERDFVGEFVDAAREFGLRVGLYFSLIDWRHPDFPHYGDRNHPMRDDPACSNENRDFGRYLAYMHAQVRELCTNYGRLDLLWFDFSYDDLRGDAWRAAELVECVSKGGNLLLNVGPDATGRFPAESLAILQEIGAWMKKNGDSIYGCGPAGLDKPEWGRYTRNGDRLYVHIFENTIGPLPLFGVDRDRVLSVRRLADGSEAPISTSWVHSDYPELAFADLGPDPVLPDPADTVLEVRLK